MGGQLDNIYVGTFQALIIALERRCKINVKPVAAKQLLSKTKDVNSGTEWEFCLKWVHKTTAWMQGYFRRDHSPQVHDKFFKLTSTYLISERWQMIN